MPDMPIMDIDVSKLPLASAGMNLLEVLAELRLRTADCAHGRKDVLDTEGNVLLEAATAGEVWDWLRETGRIA